ncbi:hypothetical protein [Geopseudomonas aromaticivorans]
MRRSTSSLLRITTLAACMAIAANASASPVDAIVEPLALSEHTQMATRINADVARAIEIFERTRSWDQVMAQVVVDGLRTEDSAARIGALAVLSFYHRSAAGVPEGAGVKPLSRSAQAYVNDYAEQIGRDYPVIAALEALDRASRRIPYDQPLTPEALDEALKLIKAPSYASLSKAFGPHEDALTQMVQFQGYLQALNSQVEHLQVGATPADARADMLWVRDSIRHPDYASTLLSGVDEHDFDMDYAAMQIDLPRTAP